MTNPTPHGQVPEALRLADALEASHSPFVGQRIVLCDSAAELRRLHAYCQELESHVIRDCMTHVQNPAENEHVAGDLSKNSAKKNMNVYAELPQSVGDHKYGGGLYTDAQMRAFADATHTLRIASHGQAPAQPTVKYVPVKADLRDKHWNHPRDDEPRTEACQKALRDRGDDEGQGLDGYWKWGFAAGFNAALATTPSPQAAQQAPAGAAPECLTCSDHGAVGNILTAEPCPDCTRLNAQPAPATQQAGWKCAPVEPTDAMVQAAHHIDLSYMPGQEGADRAAIYRAMLAAAPQQEAQEPAAVVVPCHTPSGKRVALYSAKHDLPIGTKLYTGPQCAPTAQAAESVPAADERDDFEKVFPMPSGCVRVGTGYASTGYSNWAAHTHCERWQGWQARAARDPAGSVTAECGNCFEGKSDFDHVCKKCGGSGKAADSVLEDAARYQWLFGARTEAQSACVSETVFKPLPQDEVLSRLQGFYMSKAAVDALLDAARKQGESHVNP